jgi:hypothetical protein
MPEATTRLAALRSGQVDWIEVPPPDAIRSLRQAGLQIFQRPYPHNWTHTLNLSRPPWDNKLVRQAANYAIDREGICKSLLNDTCIAAIGEVYPGHPWFGNPKVRYEITSGLSFLGLGVSPPNAEWGLMLNTLRGSIYVNPLVAALPGVMIFMTSMSFNLLSDGLRDAMDVRL